MSFSFSIQSGKEERNIPAVSELVSYVPTYTQHTEGELFIFRTEEGGREEYSSRVRVNPVCFLLISNILKVSFSFSVQGREEERNITAVSELIQYVSDLYPTY